MREYCCSVSAIISGPRLDASQVSSDLRLFPSKSRLSDRRNLAKNKNRSGRETENIWMRQIPLGQSNKYLEDQLLYWCTLLEKRYDYLTRYQKRGWKCVLDCQIRSKATVSIWIPPDLIEYLAYLGLEVRICFNFKDHERTSPVRSVNFFILGNCFKPEVLSYELGLLPDSVAPGRAQAVSGGNSTAENLVWKKLIPDKVRNRKSLESQLGYWCNLLRSRATVLNKYHRRGAQLTLSGFVAETSGSDQVRLTKKILAKLVELKLHLEISVWYSL